MSYHASGAIPPKDPRSVERLARERAARAKSQGVVQEAMQTQVAQEAQEAQEAEVASSRQRLMLIGGVAVAGVVLFVVLKKRKKKS
jgi:hypothetical protein